MSIIKKSLTVAGLLFAVNNLYAVELDPISITSSTIDIRENSKTEASTVNFISEEKIQEINPKQINEVLQTIPGITSDVRAGEVVEIHIRGVNQQEFMWEDTGVAVVIDGVPLWQNGGKFRINMKDIKNIKVIKGAASYLYGNNALAGAVIITTNKPKIKDSYSLEAQLGSFNYQDYTASIQKNFGDFSLNLNANYRATDGYWVDSELWNKSVNGKLSYYINDSTDIALGIDKTKKYEQANRAGNTGVTQAKLTPKGSGRNSFKKDNYVDLDKYYINFNKQFEDNYNLLLNTYYYNDLYDYISSPQDTTDDGQNDTYSKHTDEDIVQKGLKLEFTKDSENFGYLFGYEFGNKSFEDKAETLIDYSSTSRGVTTDYYKGERNKTEDDQDKNALYTEFKYQLTPKLVTTLNARFDNLEDSYDIENIDFDGTNWSTTKVNRSKDYNEMSYRIGLTYQLDDSNSLYSNISTGFRTPTVDQLYAGDIKGGAYKNNENLKVQDTTSYELGLRNTITLFNTKINNDFAIFQTNNKNIIGRNEGTYFSGSQVYFDNVGEARNRGFEMSLQTDPSKFISFNLSYTYLKSEYTSHKPFYVALTNLDPSYDIVGNELPRVPRHTLNLTTNINISKQTKLISEIYAKSNYYADETNNIKMPGYAYLNLQLRHNMKVNKNNFEFFAKVNNVFDKQYFQTVFLTGDRNGDDVLDAEDATITVSPGREFLVGLKYTF